MEAVEEGSRQALDGEGQAPIDQATPTKEVNCQSDEAFALQAEAQSPEEPSENTSGGGLGTSQSPSYSDDPHLAEAVKKMAQLSTAKPQKFSLNDFLAANSPELAKRAFQELGGGSGRGTPRRGGKGAADLGQHEVDLAQQRMALEELAAQCAEESAAHKEMSGLIIARLDEGRRSIENLNTMLRALGAAAAAHATAMRAAAKVKLHAQSAEQSSMPGLPAIQRQLNQLPAVVSEASTALAASLGASAGELQSLLADYRAAAKSLTAAATATHAATAKACAQLLASFKQHEAACVAFDAVFRERGRGRAVRSPELDPWATELKLNDERRALAAARDAERTYVARGLGDVQSLEGLRVNLEHNVMVGVAEAHQAAMMPFGGVSQRREAVVAPPQRPSLSFLPCPSSCCVLPGLDMLFAPRTGAGQPAAEAVGGGPAL